MIATASDGTRLHYTVSGNGPPIVLVGGKTSTIDGAWWRFLPVLSQRLRVIALDNRGAGNSDKPDLPYTTTLMAQDALTVLAAAGETSAHWFGISLGGMIAQQIALTRPAAARSLILAATHCGENQGEAGDAPLDGLRGNPLARYSNLYSTNFILEEPAWVTEDTRHFGKMPLHAIHRQDQAVRNHHTCDRLKEISQPVLIIHGRQDRMVSVRRAEEMAAALPHAELAILDPASHQVHSEQFQSVTQLVLDFVRRVESGRRA
ncbi:MAG: alpha/beta hydrolase [Candidatus Dormibacteraeota bacterium]|nr:alpha/beta hydrolase [Candidatus Dormibacteraeota bacterium]